MSRTTGNSNDSLMASYSQRTHKIIDRQSGLNGRRTPDFRRRAAAAADVERRTWRTAKRERAKRKPALTGNETKVGQINQQQLSGYNGDHQPDPRWVGVEEEVQIPQSQPKLLGTLPLQSYNKYHTHLGRGAMETRHENKDGRMG
ncbi:hypothetical protein EVAR_88115_1 [Eumeta japonica]|uniref:Uncharacterized protein n=1 Tax=Eumeta variegata TaxID=151549 RepID=A0A4C2ADD6_EUMVA|nr:hypothetical protein EVAR_88115_1 [Eumeta japonica]